MRSHILLNIIIIFLATSVFHGMAQTGQGSFKLIFPGISEEVYSITQLDNGNYSVQIKISHLNLDKKQSPVGEFMRINMPVGTSLGREPGKPSLPSLAKLIELPENYSVSAIVDSIQTQTVNLATYGKFQIIPCQPSARKNNSNQPSFIYDSVVYSTDSFFGDSLIRVERLGTMHGSLLGRITVNPFRYNPVKNLLQVTTWLEVTIVIKPLTAVNLAKSKFYSPAFERLMSSRVSRLKSASPVPGDYPMKYIILSDTLFRKALRPFIRWKTQQGFKVIEVYKGSPGVGTTNSQMKEYLKNIYLSATPDDPAPTFLLIVGDHSLMPAFYSSRYGHYTDLYWATYDGVEDYFPDLFYGRFSATDSTMLANQIEKTVEYEKYAFPNPAFLDSAMLISTGNDGNGADYGNGQINYAANYFSQIPGMTSFNYLYPGSGSKSLEIISHLSSGNCFVNYTGHGFPQYWESPYVSATNIHALTNAHKYPLVVSNGCETNYFVGGFECFGEALLRGKLKGAIGHIGCTDDSYWDEDYYWAVGVRPVVANPSYEPDGLGAYDRTFHTHNEPRSEWYPAQGQMNYAGNLAVMESGSRRLLYYWEIYNLLGDPSLMVYFGRPDSLYAQFPAQIPAGSVQFSLLAEPGSYAGLSMNDTLLDAGVIDSSGMHVFSFNPLHPGDTLTLAITKQNRIPVIYHIPSFSASDAYLAFMNYMISAEDKSPDGKPDYGETMKLRLHIKNIGGSTSKNIHLCLSSSDSLVIVQDSIQLCNILASKADTLFSPGFRIKISGNTPDQHKLPFRAEISDSTGKILDYYFFLEVNAPVITIGEISLSDSVGGKWNNRADPGRNAKVVIPIHNTGHSRMDPASLKISGKSTYLTFTDSLLVIPAIDPDSTAQLEFSFKLSVDAIPGIPLPVYLKLDTLSFHLSKEIDIRPGTYSEDFEFNTLGNLPWRSATSLPWYITGIFTLDGKYTARSGRIGDSQTTDLSIVMFVTDTGQIQFRYRVSSEEFYDYFRFYIDNNLRIEQSGQSKVLQYSENISPGWHVFLWRYQKDPNTALGEDCAWIDDIIFPPSVILPANVVHPFTDIALVKVLSPSGDSVFQSNLLPLVKIKNLGNYPVEPAQITYRLNNNPVVTESLFSFIPPGDSINYLFHTPITLNAQQKYSFAVYIQITDDSIPENDTLRITFNNLAYTDVALTQILYPYGDSTYKEQIFPIVQIRNFGNFPVQSGQIAFILNNNPVVTENISPGVLPILPGDSLTYTFNTPLNILPLQDYLLRVYLIINNDSIAANDTLQITFRNLSTTVQTFLAGYDLLLYPIPAGDFLYLKVPSGIQGGIIKIADINGRLLRLSDYQTFISGVPIRIALSGIPPGNYFAILVLDGKVFIRKFVKR